MALVVTFVLEEPTTAMANMFTRLHPDEIGCVYGYLDLQSILALAQCSRSLHRDADQRATLKNVPWLILKPRARYPTSGILLKHPRIAFTGRISHIRKLPGEFLSIIKQLIVEKLTLDADGAVLAALLPRAVHLSVFVLRNCDLGDDSMAAMINSLSGLSQYINISNNTLPGPISVAALGAHIATNNSLTFLDMRSSFPEMDGCAEILAQGLAENRSLTHLDIAGNKIGDDGLACIASAISTDMPLHTLGLGWNTLTEKSSAALDELIRKLPVLNTLAIQHNGLGDAGIAAIGASLIGSKVHHFAARCNNITPAAADSLEMLVIGLPALGTLDISLNKIEAPGVTAIAAGLRVRKTGPLQMLNLGYTDGGEAALILIRECIRDGFLKSVTVNLQYCRFNKYDYLKCHSYNEELFDGLPPDSIKSWYH
jgi:Ran GTPase-activating protein (RanGAP) involved in mRNA processing and transport